jgi:hypothetical protein
MGFQITLSVYNELSVSTSQGGHQLSGAQGKCSETAAPPSVWQRKNILSFFKIKCGVLSRCSELTELFRNKTTLITAITAFSSHLAVLCFQTCLKMMWFSSTLGFSNNLFLLVQEPGVSH